ncbi:MAG: hypothetical protein AAGA38_09345 [Pseudomonadota bacterium]
MRRLFFIAALPAALVLAGCEAPSPTGANPGTNAGTEQLRATLTPAMRRAGVSDECIQSLSLSSLTAVKSAASAGPRPRATGRNVGFGNPRRQEESRIQAIVRRECPNL